MTGRPESNEYGAYFQRYIDLVPEGSYDEIFLQNTEEVCNLFANIPGNMHNYGYADKKWTIKEVLMHLIDTERVFSYRMLVAAREDADTTLQLMDENFYAEHVDVSGRSMESLIEEFSIVRKSMKMLIGHLKDDPSPFLANAITYKVSARALAYMTVGHAMHHMKVLKERYLGVEK